MKLARSIVMTLAISVAAGIGPAFAGSVAEKNYERIQQAWEKAREAGGYGIPFVAVPRAVAEAFAGDRPEGDADRATAMEVG